MGRVREQIDVGVLASVAEDLWYDTARWPAFVDGLERVASVEGDWPRAGRVVWEATPAGRGRVVERVVRYEARVGQELAVEDDHMTATQRISFTPRDNGCRVTLALDYRIKQRSGFTPVVDALFTRRPMRDALRRTLSRFRRELEDG